MLTMKTIEMPTHELVPLEEQPERSVERAVRIARTVDRIVAFQRRRDEERRRQQEAEERARFFFD